MKLLAIYNTCGIDCIEKIDWYKQCIHSLLNQQFKDYRVILSSCKNSDSVKCQLQKEFGNDISYNFIDDVVPILVSFNHTILKCIQSFEKFDGYLYCESGIDIQQQDVFSRLYNLFQSGPYGIVSAQPDNDVGFHYEETPDLKTNHYVIPIGKSINNHLGIFSHQLLEYYGRIYPDIFGGHCNESVLSFVCAALKLRWVVHKDIVVHHELNIDKQSAGFCTHRWVRETGRPTWDHPFIIPSIAQRVITKENYDVGLGYEEARHIMIHNPDHYDENGYCINEQLKTTIKEKLFLRKNEFDYQKINYTFIE